MDVTLQLYPERGRKKPQNDTVVNQRLLHYNLLLHLSYSQLRFPSLLLLAFLPASPLTTALTEAEVSAQIQQPFQGKHWHSRHSPSSGISD